MAAGPRPRCGKSAGPTSGRQPAGGRGHPHRTSVPRGFLCARGASRGPPPPRRPALLAARPAARCGDRGASGSLRRRATAGPPRKPGGGSEGAERAAAGAAGALGCRPVRASAPAPAWPRGSRQDRKAWGAERGDAADPCLDSTAQKAGRHGGSRRSERRPAPSPVRTQRRAGALPSDTCPAGCRSAAPPTMAIRSLARCAASFLVPGRQRDSSPCSAPRCGPRLWPGKESSLPSWTFKPPPPHACICAAGPRARLLSGHRHAGDGQPCGSPEAHSSGPQTRPQCRRLKWICRQTR